MELVRLIKGLQKVLPGIGRGFKALFRTLWQLLERF
jgi:hypothetical protein